MAFTPLQYAKAKLVCVRNVFIELHTQLLELIGVLEPLLDENIWEKRNSMM